MELKVIVQLFKKIMIKIARNWHSKNLRMPNNWQSRNLEQSRTTTKNLDIYA